MRLKHLIINQHQKIDFRRDFDEDTHDYFIRIDFNFFKKQGYISDDNKINPLALYKAKCELNKIINVFFFDEFPLKYSRILNNILMLELIYSLKCLLNIFFQYHFFQCAYCNKRGIHIFIPMKNLNQKMNISNVINFRAQNQLL